MYTFVKKGLQLQHFFLVVLYSTAEFDISWVIAILMSRYIIMVSLISITSPADKSEGWWWWCNTVLLSDQWDAHLAHLRSAPHPATPRTPHRHLAHIQYIGQVNTPWITTRSKGWNMSHSLYFPWLSHLILKL